MLMMEHIEMMMKQGKFYPFCWSCYFWMIMLEVIVNNNDYDDGEDESNISLRSYCLRGKQFFPPERSLWYVPTATKCNRSWNKNLSCRSWSDLLLVLLEHNYIECINAKPKATKFDDTDCYTRKSSHALEPRKIAFKPPPQFPSSMNILWLIGHILGEYN